MSRYKKLKDSYSGSRFLPILTKFVHAPDMPEIEYSLVGIANTNVGSFLSIMIIRLVPAILASQRVQALGSLSIFVFFFFDLIRLHSRDFTRRTFGYLATASSAGRELVKPLPQLPNLSLLSNIWQATQHRPHVGEL